MWPQDILAKLSQPDDTNLHPEYRFDEFGFKIDEDNELEESSRKLLNVPFVEDAQQRLLYIFKLTSNLHVNYTCICFSIFINFFFLNSL
jgi:hypothetical protein